jgi:hypothetical protein
VKEAQWAMGDDRHQTMRLSLRLSSVVRFRSDAPRRSAPAKRPMVFVAGREKDD